MARMRYFLLTILLLQTGAALAASRATVDHNPLQEGEMVTLTLETDQDVDPDIEPLRQDFDVRGSAQSRQVSFINGQTSSSLRWTYQLLPKRTGKVTIPALTIGKDRTDPIVLTVARAGDSSNLSAERDLMIEASVDKDSVFVREQLVLTVAFYQSVDILEGSLSRPAPANTVVEPIGEGQVSEEIRDGIRYRVTRVRHALYPQNSGTITIDPIVFNGKVVVQDPNRPRGLTPFGSLIGQGRRVRLRSRPLQVQVRPQAQAAGWWLPVNSLKLTESWTPDPPVFKVGEPVTRTINMQAIGSIASLLPDLRLPEVDGLKAYPDQPVSETNPGGTTLIASKEFKIAIIPAHAGEMVLPAVQVPWWNLDKKRMETATLPERRIKVAAVAPEPGSNTTAAAPVPAATEAPAGEAETPPPPALPIVPWVLAASLLLIWLLTLLLWWRDRRRHRAAATDAVRDDAARARTAKKRITEFADACQSGNAQATARALVTAADAIRGGVRNLGQVRSLLSGDEARAAVQDLERVLYSPAQSDWNAESCRRALVPALEALNRGGAVTTDNMDSVPALYSA